MVDFHTHILPSMDDGAQTVTAAFDMLRKEKSQGVDLVVATSHFYADLEYPDQFAARRREAVMCLRNNRARFGSPEDFPAVAMGAEVLYFPGMSTCDELQCLVFGKKRLILIEPPMTVWTDSMLDEIFETGRYLRAVPVIAHVDRYMRVFEDKTLIDRVLERSMLVQVNASFFLYKESAMHAAELLSKGSIHLIGSDCHNLTSRPPNLAAARRAAQNRGLSAEFDKLGKNARYLLT